MECNSKKVSKIEYEKPTVKLETDMKFMFDGLKKKKTKIACRQCSSCHGCR